MRAPTRTHETTWPTRSGSVGRDAWLLAAALVCVLLTCAGCSQGHTVVVQLQTDLVAHVEFDQVSVQVTGQRSRTLAARDDYGRPVELAELSSVAAGTDLLIEVTLYRAGTLVVSRRVQKRVNADELVRVVITRNCIEIACPLASAPSATECRDGLCVPPDCEEDDSCGSSECTRDSECSSAIACVVPRCALGVCLDTPDSTLCGTGEFCSPSVGCLPSMMSPDAGALDAGALDAASPPPPDAYTAPDAFTPPPAFVLHHLPVGGTAWSVIATSGMVPTDEIEAAFGVPGTRDLVVMTHRDLYIFDTATRRFTEQRSRDSVFPMLTGISIGAAYSVGESVTLTQWDSWIFRWAHATRTASFERFVSESARGADWDGPLAPPTHEAFGSLFLPDNAAGWARPDAANSPCGAATIDVYGVFISTDGFGPPAMMVALYDGRCLQFVNRDIYAGSSYPPFTLPGTPPAFAMQAIDWSAGLWLFADP